LIGVNNKLEQDSFLFDTEKARIAYVFGCTEGQANTLLTPRMKRGCTSPFTSVEEMFQLLSDLFSNPAEKEEAIEDFRALIMVRNQPFFEFKMEFLRLAGLAEIPPVSYVDELYSKLTDKLKELLAPWKPDWGTNFTVACARIQQTDTRLTLNTRQRLAARTMARTSAGTTIVTSTTSKVRGLLPKPTDNVTDRAESVPALRFASRPWTSSESTRISPAKTVENRNLTPRPVDASTLKCHNCGKLGHIRKYCDQPPQGSIQEIEEEDEEPLEEYTAEESEDLSGKEHT
jgi:hypothetical protein